MTSWPLEGIRVVDLTSNIAAPFASVILADLGAEVLHVEAPHGDDSRRMSPVVGDGSAYFHVVNRNKAGLPLDIREPLDRARLDALLAEADVFVSNLRPAKLAALGLDASVLTERFPTLVHATLSAYGAHGPDAGHAGFDGVVQARTGITSITGSADGPPARAGVSVLDIGAGTWLAVGVLAALVRRSHTGVGGAVATSLLETGAAWVSYHLAAHQLTGEPSGRHGTAHPAFAPYGIYATGDGAICLGIGGDLQFERLCDALDSPQLRDDPRYRTNADRVAHATTLRAELEQILATRSAHDVVARCRAFDLAVDLAQQPEDLLVDPQIAALDLLQSITITDDRSLRIPSLPITIDGRRPPIRHGGPSLSPGSAPTAGG